MNRNPPNPPVEPVASRPDFLIIAAQKSGSIWLRDNLNKHPDLFIPKGATHFFNSKWRKGPEWYFAHFDPPEGTKAVDEHCPSYAFPHKRLHKTPKRIDDTLPDVRLLAILRNPVDRAYSAFGHHMERDRIPPDADLFDWLDENRIAAGGRYADNLGPFIQHFGDRLHVVLLEDVRPDGPGVYPSILSHIGVDTEFVPSDLDAVVHTQGVPEESPYHDPRQAASASSARTSGRACTKCSATTSCGCRTCSIGISESG